MLGGYPKVARRIGSLDGYPIRRSPLGQLSGLPDIARRLDVTHPINSGLCGWWPLDEGQGVVARDLSLYQNHGTLTNMANPATATSGWGAGVSQRELAFDGSNDYISVPHGAHLAITGAITLSIWFRFAGNPTGYPACQKGGSYPQPYGISSQPSRTWNFVRGNGSSQAYVLGVTSTPVGVWGHAVGTWVGGLFAIYVNGILDNTASASPTVSDTGTAFGIGANFPTTANQWMTGTLAHVRLYNRALAASEIKQLYADKWIGSIGGIT